jgi:hypothetical protein
MSSPNDPSIEELRTRAELSRAALAANVAQLRGCVTRVTSPANIKAEVRSYARSEREGLVERLRQRAADNPLQAAAVTAAVAYPALSLVRAIPLPLMLIGAGLFLTTKRGQDSSAAMQEKMNEAVQRGTETVTAVVEPVAARVTETVSGLREQAASVAGAASAAVASAADPATLRSGVEAARDKLTTMASDTMHSVSDRARHTGSSTGRFVSDNAMLIAGLGAIAGAVLAAAFPLSETENRVLGPGKRKVKDAARAAAAMGMDKAGSVVADTIESVKSAAAREGLDGAGLQETVGDFADKARAVAERSVDAALGQHQDQQQSFSERNPT